MLTERQSNLLDLLKLQNEYQPVVYFARKLGVSERTIHSDVKLLEEFFDTHDSQMIKITKKRGVGIKLVSISNDWKPNSKENACLSIKNRRIEIMRLMLLDSRTLSYNFLSKHFLVSKTSIQNDLEIIERILSFDKDLFFKNNSNGTSISGSELGIQKGMFKFSQYVLNNKSTNYGYSAFELVKNLEHFFGKKIVTVCTDILYRYSKKHTEVISDIYTLNILISYIIISYRLSQGKHISKDIQEKLGTDVFYTESAEYLLNKAATRLSFSFTENDVKLLSYYLTVNRLEQVADNEIDNKLINEFIKDVSEQLNVKFDGDQKLLNQLRKHIAVMFFRLKMRSTTKNPFTSKVKIEFPLTFNIITSVVLKFEQLLNVKFNEDEIGYLTIYFQSAIENAKLNKKILIVCQMGIATSELIVNRLKNRLPSFDTIEVASYAEFSSIDARKYDLIISTISLNKDDVIYVSPLLTNEDIDKILSSGYKPSINKKNDIDNNPYKVNQEFFKLENIILDTDFSSKEEVLDFASTLFKKRASVNDLFLASLKEREKIGGTDLPVGVAIPHGNYANVFETTVLFVKNKRKFKWHTYFVDIICIIAISPEDVMQTRNIMSNVYKIVDEEYILNQLREAKNEEEFLKVLGGL